MSSQRDHLKEDYAFTLGYCNIIIAIHHHCLYAAHLHCRLLWKKILAHRVLMEVKEYQYQNWFRIRSIFVLDQIL